MGADGDGGLADGGIPDPGTVLFVGAGLFAYGTSAETTMAPGPAA
jgi:hypothetical protein